MISTQDIKNKEVINIYDGKSLGFVEDIEVNLERGTIEGIIVPEPRGFFSFFGRTGEQVIRWRDIKRIGDDVILVDVAGVLDQDYEEEYTRNSGGFGGFGGLGGLGGGPAKREERGYEGEYQSVKSFRSEQGGYPTLEPEPERSFQRTMDLPERENDDDDTAK